MDWTVIATSLPCVLSGKTITMKRLLNMTAMLAASDWRAKPTPPSSFAIAWAFGILAGPSSFAVAWAFGILAASLHVIMHLGVVLAHYRHEVVQYPLKDVCRRSPVPGALQLRRQRGEE